LAMNNRLSYNAKEIKYLSIKDLRKLNGLFR